MKNKETIYILLIVIIIYIAVTNINYYNQINIYKQNENIFINNVLTTLKDKYPNITKTEIIEILNSKNSPNTLKEYNIIKEDFALLTSQNNNTKNIIINNAIVLIFIIIIILVMLYNNHLNKIKIKNITKQLEKINQKNYQIILKDGREDELSILESQVYKTGIILKEAAENSLKDKENIKEAIENISHQLKTPLTSITIMLDNIIDNPNMDLKTRNEFLTDINREITNINFLIQNLLKLSRFDVNAITYNNDYYNVDKIIFESINKLNPLCDLKNIKIEYHKQNFNIYCDFNWQIEAITNILKNAIEHSDTSSKVIIEASDNKVYSQITIKDFGTGMSEEEQKNIFKRFYKGSSSLNDSFGIGLSLAKTIINKNNGTITVDSKKGKYTEFIIKYFK